MMMNITDQSIEKFVPYFTHFHAVAPFSTKFAMMAKVLLGKV
jgi:hypothetical protein